MFHIILTSAFMSPKWSRPIKFCNKNLLHIYLSNIPAIATENLLASLLFSLFTTCFGPYGQSLGEMQLHHLHILKKPSILQRIRYLFPMFGTHPAYVILFGLMTPIIFGEGYRFWNSSLCIFLKAPVIYPLSGPNILFRNLFPNTLNMFNLLLQP
jgi:hypothetical protein